MSVASELFTRLDAFVGQISLAVDEGDWDTLSGLLSSRQEILNQLSALILSENESKVMVNMMRIIQKTDEQFIRRVQDQKNILQEEASKLTHDRKAIQAYQSI